MDMYGLIGLGIVALFVVLVALLIVQSRRARAWREAHDAVIANWHTARDNNDYLRSQIALYDASEEGGRA